MFLYIGGHPEPSYRGHQINILYSSDAAIMIRVTTSKCLTSMLSGEALWCAITGGLYFYIHVVGGGGGGQPFGAFKPLKKQFITNLYYFFFTKQSFVKIETKIKGPFMVVGCRPSSFSEFFCRWL